MLGKVLGKIKIYGFVRENEKAPTHRKRRCINALTVGARDRNRTGTRLPSQDFKLRFM